jgi:leader peptidase (prepilin peptidase) / N-methyltransferase
MELSNLFPLVPVWYQIACVAIFGAIIGSFLNVVLYRFHTGKSLAGRSHCLSCGKHLSWFELLPVISYLTLCGQCRHCSAAIPVRYLVVEVLTAVAFLAGLTLAYDIPTLILWWVILSLLILITIYDIRHFIVPDALTIALTVTALVLVLYIVIQKETLVTLPSTILASLAGVTFFFGLWFFSKGTWLGFGDVKLAFPLGILVGAPLVFSFIVYSFWIGAAIGGGMLLVVKIRGKLSLQAKRKQLTMKSVVPFAPFLIAGALTVLLTGYDVLSLFTF